LPVLAVIALATQATFAQQQAQFQSTVAGDVLQPFKDNQITWMTNIWTYANRLFGFLALIEFGWSLIVLALEKSDFRVGRPRLSKK
jgi:type IV secretory pathway TrbL component